MSLKNGCIPHEEKEEAVNEFCSKIAPHFFQISRLWTDEEKEKIATKNDNKN
jgi:hypothetical protein